MAANIAGELAAEGKSVLLVDADSYGASIAAVLGLLDEAAGLAQACRLADQGLLDAEALLEGGHAGGHQARDLPGPDRDHPGGPVDRTPGSSTVAGAGARQGDRRRRRWWTPASASRPTRNSASTRWPRAGTLQRCAAWNWRTLFSPSGAADPVGVPRLVRGLAELELAVPQASPVVVLNKVRAAAVGRSPERQLRDAWERYGPSSASSAFLPADTRGGRGSAGGVVTAGSGPGIQAAAGHRGSGLCTCPAKSQILCIFFHSKAPG